MRKNKDTGLDFVIDRLTDSILNTISGDSFETIVSKLVYDDLKQVTKKKKWNFNWKQELEYNDREVYKLTIIASPEIIQGMISVTVGTDQVFMNLLESAPFNIGKDKLYEGVAGNLVAHACRVSFQRGFDGYVGFVAKTRLVPHYEKALGAIHIGGGRMMVEERQAKILVDKYFKGI